jgi:hypothetical protein
MELLLDPVELVLADGDPGCWGRQWLGCCEGKKLGCDDGDIGATPAVAAAAGVEGSSVEDVDVVLWLLLKLFVEMPLPPPPDEALRPLLAPPPLPLLVVLLLLAAEVELPPPPALEGCDGEEVISALPLQDMGDIT